MVPCPHGASHGPCYYDRAAKVEFAYPVLLPMSIAKGMQINFPSYMLLHDFVMMWARMPVTRSLIVWITLLQTESDTYWTCRVFLQLSALCSIRLADN